MTAQRTKPAQEKCEKVNVALMVLTGKLNSIPSKSVIRTFKSPCFKKAMSGQASSGRFIFWLTFLINPSIMPLGVLLFFLYTN